MKHRFFGQMSPRLLLLAAVCAFLCAAPSLVRQAYQKISQNVQAPTQTTSHKAYCASIVQRRAENASLSDPILRFAGFSMSAEFRAEHDNPIPFVFEGKGTTTRIKGADGKECFGYEIASAKSQKNVIFVVHEWWGLNDYIKRESEILADELGVRVIALDLYDGNVATTREDAAKYVQQCSPERVRTIITAFTDYVGKDARIATIGWCFGGGWSHQAALQIGKQTVGCVIYYGMPELDTEKLKAINAPTLGIFAKQEQRISPEVVAKFEEAMKAAGKQLEVHSYDAEHGFANPSNPRHNKKYTEEARKIVLAFFKKCFA